MDKHKLDWEDSDMDNEEPTLTLTDPEGRSLICYIELMLEHDGKEYALLQPVDYPVEVFAWEDEGEEDDDSTLVAVEEDELNRIFDTARAVLGEQNLKLKHTALCLTVEGELPEVDEEDVLTLEIDQDGEVEAEEFQPLAMSFFHEEREYAIYTPLNPVMFVARLQPDQSPQLISPEEFKVLQPLIDQQLEEQMFEDIDD
jgi:Protein of unknown function (DUF3727)/Protein of unknown function (DUF1292)